MFSVKFGNKLGRTFQSRAIWRKVQHRQFSQRDAPEKVKVATGFGAISAFIGTAIYFWQNSAKRTTCTCTLLAKENTVNAGAVNQEESVDARPVSEINQTNTQERSGTDTLQDAIQKARDLSQRIKVVHKPSKLCVVQIPCVFIVSITLPQS